MTKTFSDSSFDLSGYISLLTLGLFLIPNISTANQKYEISANIERAIPTEKINLFWFYRVGESPQTKEKIKSSTAYDLSFAANVYDNVAFQTDLLITGNSKFTKQKSLEIPDIDGIYTGIFQTKINTRAIFANIRYNFKNTILPFTPYIIAGFGSALNTMKALTVTYKNSVGTEVASQTIKGKRNYNFAYQAGLGVLIPLGKGFNMNLAYKYRDLGKVSLKNPNDPDLQYTNPIKGRLTSSNFLCGLSYLF